MLHIQSPYSYLLCFRVHSKVVGAGNVNYFKYHLLSCSHIYIQEPRLMVVTCANVSIL